MPMVGKLRLADVFCVAFPADMCGSQIDNVLSLHI